MDEKIPRSAKEKTTENIPEDTRDLIIKAITTFRVQEIDYATRKSHTDPDVFERQKKLLSDALTSVERDITQHAVHLPKAKYLEQIGGPHAFVAREVLERVADATGSIEEFREILKEFHFAFFHVSGLEFFYERIRQRLASKGNG